MSKIFAAILSIAFFAGSIAPAKAIPVNWDVIYTNTAGSLSVSGSFTYDADLNNYSSINLTANDSIGISNTVYSFLSPFTLHSANAATFRDSTNADRTGEKFISLSTSVALSNAGGVISNAISQDFLFQVMRCNNSDCSSSSGISVVDETSNSTLTGTVPLPASAALLTGGFLAMGALRRRKAKRR